MKNCLFVIALFCVFTLSAQESESKSGRNTVLSIFKANDDGVNPAYLKLDLSLPLRYNSDHDEVDPQTGEKGYWFLPDGIYARVGIGYNYEDLFMIGATTGIDWMGSFKIVTTPVFAEARISPLIGEDLRLVATAGYGHAFAIGRGNLQGNFQKYSLGIGNDEGSYIFIEVNYYGYPLQDLQSYGTLNLGISFKII